MGELDSRWVRFEWRLPGNSFDSPAPKGYRLRSAVGDDLAAMLRVIATAYASDPVWTGESGKIVERVGGRIRERLSDPTAFFVVAVHGSQVVGLNGVALKSPTRQNFITGVCIDPAHQGRGLSVPLLARSLAWLRDQNLGAATVITDANAVAVRVYRHFDATVVEHVWDDNAGDSG